MGGADQDLYAYTGNNPMGLVDPTGLLLERIWSNPQQRASHLDNAVTLNQFIEYTDGKSLWDLQHAIDNGTLGNSSAGGPATNFRYVINPANPAEVIDMRHFLVVGPKGETFGLFVEIVQLYTDPSSAFDAQELPVELSWQAILSRLHGYQAHWPPVTVIL